MAGLRDYDTVYRGTTNRLPHGQTVIRPLDIPHLHPLVDDAAYPPDHDADDDHDAALRNYLATGCGLLTLITEKLLLHPFVVLRRQCQVNPGSNNYHLLPVSLVPVALRLHQTQGINALWKGIGSVLLVNGMMLAIQDFVSKLTCWPKEMPCYTSLKPFGQHLLLKCISIGLTTPFYSASLVETVQSEIASETPGILDVFKDGAIRLLELTNKGRLIPIYSLLPPTIAYGLSKYLFTSTVQKIATYVVHTRQKRSQRFGGAYSKTTADSLALDVQLQSAFVSSFLADVVFYPWETVVHRLHLQGTRTIIDNLDTGRSVTPLLTGYTGQTDCYATILATEGPLGFYKGFGALILQFSVHLLIVRTVKWILTELATPSKPPKPPSSSTPRKHPPPPPPATTWTPSYDYST